MRTIRLLTLLGTVTALTAPGTLSARDDATSNGSFDRSPILLANVEAGTRGDVYLANLLAALRAADLDGNGFDRADIANIEQAELERAQADHFSRLKQYQREWQQLVGTDAESVSLEELQQAFALIASGRREAQVMFERMDRNDDGAVTHADLSPNPRPSELEQFAQFDADGDGAISIEEVMAARPSRSRNMPDAAQAFAERDLNRDGQLTVAEFFGVSSPPSLDTRANLRRRERFEHLLTIDPDGDGRLTEAELGAVFTGLFDRIDTDGDGTISRGEFARARPDLDRARRMAEARLCPVPAPSPNARVFAIGAQEGQLISTLALGSQDEVTSIVDLTIEPGREPLYLMLVSPDPVIWRISGDRERIEQVGVFGQDKDEAGNVLAGVAGVDETRVFFAGADCLSTTSFLTRRQEADANLAATIGAVTGIAVEALGVPHAVGAISVPSLAISQPISDLPAPGDFDPTLWREAVRFSPRGVDTPDAASVVSEASLIPYEVLPVRFGPAQLLAQGAIEPTGNASEFRIVRPIPRFPAGLHGAVSVNFVLPEAIPMPTGDQGHACIFSEAGEYLGENTFCRRAPRSNALTVQVRPDGAACLYSDSGTEEACFPEDGRPLVVTETPDGRAIVPQEPATAPPPVTATVPSVPEAARSRVEVIPMVRR